MAKVKMSIHRALGELKTYDHKIKNATQEVFIGSNKKSNEKIGGKSIEQFSSMIQGNMDSVKALMENKKRIKSAIVMSNATTKVEIAGVEYTVADAIERKSAVALEEVFLHNLQTQYIRERGRVENENQTLPNKLENYLQSVLGDKSSRTAQDIDEHTKLFMQKNTYELIDPANVEDYVKTLARDILDFKNEVDYVLSESNATTFVEVDLAD